MPTRVLVVGAGGREHAIAWKLSGEPGVNEVGIAPPRHAITAMPHVDGIEANINNPEEVVRVARSFAAELVVIGPEAPLAAGVADALLDAAIPVFGPTALAARIETSKRFCRDVARAAGVPMADGRTFDSDDRAGAMAFARNLAADGRGVVVKADGLAAGKGVTVCEDAEEATAAIADLDGPVVIEERLEGVEASVIAICDGRDALALPISRDHKRLGDGDGGPNTGGMGAYSPLPDLPDESADAILERFHRPVLAELARRGTPFRGALYAGLMITNDGPRLLEFNARFGDPETQVIMPRIAIALGPLLLSAAKGELAAAVAWHGPAVSRVPVLPTTTVGIVLASAGYPGKVEAGERITALDDDGRLPDAPDVLVFHSGTDHDAAGVFAANGGRVVTVVGRGANLDSARSMAEAAADRIAWPGMQRRHDIGAKTLAAVASQ
jgi:phosphoribosylamine--glycine ligase